MNNQHKHNWKNNTFGYGIDMKSRVEAVTQLRWSIAIEIIRHIRRISNTAKQTENTLIQTRKRTTTTRKRTRQCRGPTRNASCSRRDWHTAHRCRGAHRCNTLAYLDCASPILLYTLHSPKTINKTNKICFTFLIFSQLFNVYHYWIIFI